MKSKVSIIMPVLNGERFIAEAIESILAQTYSNYELIVVDDGSTDSTPEVVEAYRPMLQMQYVRHSERRGIAPSMNDGVRHATGELIAFLDHDDAWFPDFLETQTAYLEAHPDVGMVHSDFQTIDGQGQILESSVAACRRRKRPSGFVFRELFLDSFIVGNSVLIRKECFTKLGLFDESLRWGDYLMWMRIARHYKVEYVDKVLTKYRQHTSQSTRTVAVSRTDEESVGLQAIKKIIEQYPDIRNEIGKDSLHRRMATLYCDLAMTRYEQGARRNARWCFGRAISCNPRCLWYYFLYAATFIHPSLLRAARQAWRFVRKLDFRHIRAGGPKEIGIGIE